MHSGQNLPNSKIKEILDSPSPEESPHGAPPVPSSTCKKGKKHWYLLGIGIAATLVASVFSIRNPNAYTAAALALNVIAPAISYFVVLSAVSLVVSLISGSLKKNWFPILSWLFLIAGLFDVAAKGYMTFALRPKLDNLINELAEDGKLPNYQPPSKQHVTQERQTSSYNHDGVRFRFPKRWRLDEDSEIPSSNYRFIILETPEDALILVQLYENMELRNIKDFAQGFSENAKENMPYGNVGRSSYGSVKQAGGYVGLTEEFTIDLMGQSLPNLRVYRYMKSGQTACFLVAQMATEDKEKVLPGFKQILGSFEYRNPN